MNRKLLSAGLVAVLASAGCAIAPRADPVFAPVGSSWTSTYRATGSLGSANDQRSVRVLPEQTWQGRKVRATEGTDFTTLSDPVTGSWFTRVKGPTPLLTWDPPIGWEWPLTVGKTWTKKHRVTVHATKQTIDFEARWNVESYEDITVPAGTFKAFKVTYSDNIGNENINWWSPAVQGNTKTRTVRTSKHAAGPGTIDTELVSHTIGR